MFLSKLVSYRVSNAKMQNSDGFQSQNQYPKKVTPLQEYLKKVTPLIGIPKNIMTAPSNLPTLPGHKWTVSNSLSVALLYGQNFEKSSDVYSWHQKTACQL